MCCKMYVCSFINKDICKYRGSPLAITWPTTDANLVLGIISYSNELFGHAKKHNCQLSCTFNQLKPEKKIKIHWIFILCNQNF